jgi:hypothetical protein
MMSQFLLLLALGYICVANNNIQIYFYPIEDNATVPSGCGMIRDGSDKYILCKCDCQNNGNICSYTFRETTGLLPHISFIKPRVTNDDIIKYTYLINNGINNFKINYRGCTSETCFAPTVTYFMMNTYPYTAQIVCFDN